MRGCASALLRNFCKSEVFKNTQARHGYLCTQQNGRSRISSSHTATQTATQPHSHTATQPQPGTQADTHTHKHKHMGHKQDAQREEGLVR